MSGFLTALISGCLPSGELYTSGRNRLKLKSWSSRKQNRSDIYRADFDFGTPPEGISPPHSYPPGGIRSQVRSLRSRPATPPRVPFGHMLRLSNPSREPSSRLALGLASLALGGIRTPIRGLERRSPIRWTTRANFSAGSVELPFSSRRHRDLNPGTGLEKPVS